MTMERRAIRGIVAGVLCFSVLAGALVMIGLERADAQRRVVPQTREAVQSSFAPIVKRAAPAVVNVYVSSRVRQSRSPFANDPFFGRFFGDDYDFGAPRERVQSSLGSGVIVSADGVIVTNTHVVKARGKTEIRVALSDQREFDAKVIAQDKKTDIAILKIEGNGEDFPFMRFANSDRLEVGDLVLAIGNPFGVGQTVTSGIVSALSRSQVASEAVFIQTDAAINPGNSGGALVDIRGRLIGINTAIFSRSGGSNGIGFAIPSNLVRLHVDSAVEGRKVERPWLGARLQTMDRDMAAALGVSRISGAVVMRVYDGGPAERAGLEVGDIITKVDKFDVADARSVNYRMTTRGVGKRSRLTVLREGRELVVPVRLAAPPKLYKKDFRNLSGGHPLDGARVANVVPRIVEELELDSTKGVVVISVRRRSVASRLGFRRGDVITHIGRKKIRSLEDLEPMLERRRRVWRMTINRGGRDLDLRVPG
ncbi:MAG: DegQ family serine endoprotease [Alphaproteobacteria bacterium]|nr:DegQ family serine endoprotease [Alphaproteobacteria bacterium]